MTNRGAGIFFDLAELPRRIPRYELDPSVRIEQDQSPTQIGVYLPDVPFAAARLLYPNEFEGGIRAFQGGERSDYVNKETGKRDYHWEKTQWAETGWTLIRRIEDEFIDVPERGFSPRGEPDELYTWPERESQFSDCRRTPYQPLA